MEALIYYFIEQLVLKVYLHVLSYTKYSIPIIMLITVFQTTSHKSAEDASIHDPDQQQAVTRSVTDDSCYCAPSGKQIPPYFLTETYLQI